MTIKLWPLFSVPSRSAYSMTKLKSSWKCTSYPCRLLSSPARHPGATRDGTTTRIQTRTRRVSVVYFFRSPRVGCSTSFKLEEQQKSSTLLDGFYSVFPGLVDLFASAIITSNLAQVAVMTADTHLAGKSFSSLCYPRRPYLQHGDCVKDFYCSVTNL
jgi:hypothetical protein